MLQSLRFTKYFPFSKRNIFKTLILALILISGNFCLSQNLDNKNFKLKNNSYHHKFFDENNFNDEKKETVNKSSFFAGIGTLITIAQTDTRKSNIYLSAAIDINLKIYKIFYINTGLDIHGAESNGFIAFQFNVLPGIGYQFNSFAIFGGFGGTIAIDPGYSNGVGAGLKAILKTDYYINNNYGLSLEIKHLLSDYDFSGDYFINIGATIKL
jgi:hypothetical protein